MNYHKFFANIDCRHYPCHNMDSVNCMFCFCPLYHFENCEGSFIIRENGLKDCSQCLLPHSPAGYDFVVEKLRDSLTKRK